ncbi:MAG: cytochrome b5-like heme/steroid binding domain-containing protein [Terracoccus sp.]
MLATDDHESNLFSSIAGLPLHPLVVHLAVVVLPASAIALIVIIAVPRWRRPYSWLAVAAALLGTVGTFVAKQSGAALADQGGLPADHAEWGDRLFVAAAVFAVVTVVWFALDLLARRAHPSDAGPAADAGSGPGSRSRAATATATATAIATRAPSALIRVAGAGVVVLSLVVLGLTVVVGHSGATAVWGGRRPAAASARTAQADVVGPAAVAADPPRSASTTPSSREEASRTPRSTASPTTRPKASGPAAFSLANVGKHGSASSCWAAIDGGVYDLTRWIDAHPGGSDAILGICGTDATAAFNAQHGGQGSPARELAAFKLGVLG